MGSRNTSVTFSRTKPFWGVRLSLGKMAFLVPDKTYLYALLTFEYFCLTVRGGQVISQVYHLVDSTTFSGPSNCITSYDMTNLGLSGAVGNCLSECNALSLCGGFWVDGGPPIGQTTTSTTTTSTTTTTTTTTTLGSCLGVSADSSCCTSSSPCELGQGDCDSDNDCAGLLVCGIDNCAQFYHLAVPSYDCCTEEVASTSTTTTTTTTTSTPPPSPLPIFCQMVTSNNSCSVDTTKGSPSNLFYIKIF